jgi:hypothetical protein
MSSRRLATQLKRMLGAAAVFSAARCCGQPLEWTPPHSSHLAFVGLLDLGGESLQRRLRLAEGAPLRQPRTIRRRRAQAAPGSPQQAHADGVVGACGNANNRQRCCAICRTRAGGGRRAI